MDDRQTVAAELLSAGEPKASVAATLQRDFNISRATAYRLIRQAEATLPAEYHQPFGRYGTIDPLAEAEQLYGWFKRRGEMAEASRLLPQIFRYRKEYAMSNYHDAWEINQSLQDAPPH